jgi:uncharacterized membrane protein YgcG
MNTVRFERRAGRATAGIDPRLPKLAVVMLAVFLGYFAIGRVTDTHSSRVGSTSSLSTLFHSGATPILLSGAPPIASAVSAHRVISRKSEASAIRATSARKQPIVREEPIARKVSSAPTSSSPRQVQPASSPSAEAPSPPARVSPTTVSAPSTGGSSGSAGGHSGSSQGGGGSFDSSG